MTRMYRQGDVLLISVAEIPADAFKVPRDRGRVVLAYGEATGHAHAINDPQATLLEAPDRGRREVFDDEFIKEEVAVVAAGRHVAAAGFAIESIRPRYVSVDGDAPVALTHQEHDPIMVAPGTYQVVRQREYTPQSERIVAD